MPGRLLTPRERFLWAAFFVAAAAVLVATRFTSDDPDSALYAGLADRLSHEPVRRWIAPEWWGFWPEAQMTGLFREHPAGVFILSATLTLAGIPAPQGAYVIGVAAGLASLLMMGALIRRLASHHEARASLVLLQLMPVAFIFRVRANHEYPMLVCLLLTLIGLAWIAERRPLWMGAAAVATGLAAGLLIKGIFVILILLAIAIWIAINPPAVAKTRGRYCVALAVGLIGMAGAAWTYDVLYRAATGGPFWGPYWQRQLGPVTILTPLEGASTLAGHILFYVSRVLWHPAPWSFALVAAAWKWRAALPAWVRNFDDPARRGALFAILFAGVAILLLSPSSRSAERYAFSATYAVAGAGVVVALRLWPSLVSAIRRADERIPALPALLWLVLVLLRLGIGPLLPRLS